MGQAEVAEFSCPVALESLTHNSLVHRRLVLQRPGVHAHNLRRAKVRGYLRTGPGSTEGNPVGCARGES